MEAPTSPPIDSIFMPEKPFFLSGRIPLPESPEPLNGNSRLSEEITEVWNYAEGTFVALYQDEKLGTKIRKALSNRIDCEPLRLEDVGEVLGEYNQDKLRKVRSALKVGELAQNIEDGLWKFNEMEIVQFMVGIIARKYRNTFIAQLNGWDLPL